MRAYKVKGPTKLSGTIHTQGAKNSAMKHVLIPLLSPGKWSLHNIPRIGSIDTLVKILESQNAAVQWTDKNSLVIQSTEQTKDAFIPSELFYYTSAGIHALPILTSIDHTCTVERLDERSDYGGCAIGTRSLDAVRKTLAEIGIESNDEGNHIIFRQTTEEPFEMNFKMNTFSGSVNVILAALKRKGTSVIHNITGEAEMYDIITFLQHAGADIRVEGSNVYVTGGKALMPIEYHNMYDRQDVPTWIAMALTTNSELRIENINFKAMRFDSLQPTLDAMNIHIDWHDTYCIVPAQRDTNKPAHIIAAHYPKFQTEWQVIFSPILTQISGTSTAIEALYANRMRHWDELQKMGANFEYYTDPQYPEVDGNPKAVRVTGLTKLHCATVSSNDVRRGAALVIAGLIAHGETIVTEIEQIERGYENFVSRLQSIGGNITEVEI